MIENHKITKSPARSQSEAPGRAQNHKMPWWRLASYLTGRVKCWLRFHDWELRVARFLDYRRCDYIWRCRRRGCEAEKIRPNYRRRKR